MRTVWPVGCLHCVKTSALADTIRKTTKNNILKKTEKHIAFIILNHMPRHRLDTTKLLSPSSTCSSSRRLVRDRSSIIATTQCHPYRNTIIEHTVMRNLNVARRNQCVASSEITTKVGLCYRKKQPVSATQGYGLTSNRHTVAVRVHLHAKSDHLILGRGMGGYIYQRP
jgi:hypothetical protein